jgi:hypothetical protein
MNKLLIFATMTWLTAIVAVSSDAFTQSACKEGIFCLSTEDAIAQTQASCLGSYQNSGACMVCVDFIMQRELKRTGQITGAQAGEIDSFFARGACKAQCMPVTCRIANSVCGTLEDGCGNTLTCGASCGAPSRAECFCRDGSVLSVCGDIDCGSGPAIDGLCSPVCASHGGELGGGCFPADPICSD